VSINIKRNVSQKMRAEVVPVPIVGDAAFDINDVLTAAHTV
jgi:hypothetical protein